MRARSPRWPVFPVALLAAIALPLIVPSGAPQAADGEAAPAEPAATAPAGPFLNVKVLTDVSSKQEMRQRMKTIAASLGVRCSYCHVTGEPESDAKPEKVKAREMMRMVAHVNEAYLADAEHVPAVTCWTCHRGEKEPQRDVPPEAYPAVDAMQPAETPK